jgi:hypothetical protein
MVLTQKEIKQRYFDKVYREAPMIECACGCGKKIKSKDKYGRDVRFINGHNGRKYDNPTQYKREWNHRNRKSRREYRDNYQRKRKGDLIKLLGGKCEDCGLEYNGENGCLFQFHHKNPKEKEIRLTLNKMGIAWSKIIKESKKCKLVCANCHFLIHGSKY